MDILARFVDKEEKILVKLIIVSAHVLERISKVANTGVELKRYIILSKAQVSERMIQIVSPV